MFTIAQVALEEDIMKALGSEDTVELGVMLFFDVNLTQEESSELLERLKDSELTAIQRRNILVRYQENYSMRHIQCEFQNQGTPK